MLESIEKFYPPFVIAGALLAYINNEPYLAAVFALLAAVSISDIAVERMSKGGGYRKGTLGATLIVKFFSLLAHIACVVLLVAGQHYVLAAIFAVVTLLVLVASTVSVLAAIGSALASEQP